MKKIFLLPVIFLMLNCKYLYSQTLKDSLAQLSKPELSEYYSQKAKNKKTAAFVLLGGGVIVGLIGATLGTSDIIYEISNNNSQNSNGGGGIFLFAIGTAAIVASIPLFISSLHNKRKANLILQNQPISFGNTQKDMLSLGLSIPLGK